MTYVQDDCLWMACSALQLFSSLAGKKTPGIGIACLQLNRQRLCATQGWVFHKHCGVPLASSFSCPPKCTYCQPICAGRRFCMHLKKWPLPASSVPCCHSSIRLPFPIQSLLLTRSAAIITCCCCITLATHQCMRYVSLLEHCNNTLVLAVKA